MREKRLNFKKQLLVALFTLIFLTRLNFVVYQTASILKPIRFCVLNTRSKQKGLNTPSTSSTWFSSFFSLSLFFYLCPPTRSSFTLSGHPNAEALSLLEVDTELTAIFIPYWCSHSIRLFWSVAANGIQYDKWWWMIMSLWLQATSILSLKT